MQFFSTDKYLAQPISGAFYERDVLVIKCSTLYIAANETHWLRNKCEESREC